MRLARCLTLPLCVLALQAGAPVHAQRAPARTASPATPGNWQTDAEGRQYRVEPLPRSVAVKISDAQVRTAFGVVADLVREDATSFYIKVYKVDAPSPQAAPARLAVDPAIAPPERVRFRFVPFNAGLPTSGQWRENVVLADINADGRIDIVAPPPRKSPGAPVVYLGDGAGSWRRWDVRPFPQRAYDYGAVAVGDLEGDGDLDLVLAVHLAGTIALRRVAPDRFEDASTGLDFVAKPGDTVFSSRAIALVDCNADQRLDIAALSEGPRLQRAPGAGGATGVLGLATYVQAADGTWTMRRHGAAERAFGPGLAAADVDGDGHVDLVAASGVLGRQDLVHRGDGQCGWTTDTVAEIRPRSYITAVAATDLDGDGRGEIALAYVEFLGDMPMNGIDLLKRDATGTWQRRAIVRDAGRARIEAIAIGDLDGDKGPEIAAVGDDGRTRVFSVTPRGAVSIERQIIASPNGCAGASVVIGDLDADGIGDLVIAYSDEGTTACGGLAAFKTQRRRGRR